MTAKHGSGNFNQLTRTGKSFLLNSVFLWCLVNGKRVKAAAPTGIAAANIEIERTNVRATTIHQLFEFDNEFKTKIDFTRQVQSVVELLNLDVLLLDEVRSQFTHTHVQVHHPRPLLWMKVLAGRNALPRAPTTSYQPTQIKAHHCLHHGMRA